MDLCSYSLSLCWNCLLQWDVDVWTLRELAWRQLNILTFSKSFISRSECLSVCLSVCLSFCLSVFLYVCLSPYRHYHNDMYTYKLCLKTCLFLHGFQITLTLKTPPQQQKQQQQTLNLRILSPVKRACLTDRRRERLSIYLCSKTKFLSLIHISEPTRPP